MLARMEEAARLDDEALKAETPATQKAARHDGGRRIRAEAVRRAAAAQFFALLSRRAILGARARFSRAPLPARALRNRTSACSTAACSSGCASGSSRLPMRRLQPHVRSGVLRAQHVRGGHRDASRHSRITAVAAPRAHPAPTHPQVDDVLQSALRTSQVGRYVKLLSVHPKETPQNRRSRRRSSRSGCGASLGTAPSSGRRTSRCTGRSRRRKTCTRCATPARRRARRARRMMRRTPTCSRLAPGPRQGDQPPPDRDGLLGAARVDGEGRRELEVREGERLGRLSERFTNNQRGKTKTTQAATLSIEGRGVDRFSCAACACWIYSVSSSQHPILTTHLNFRFSLALSPSVPCAPGGSHDQRARRRRPQRRRRRARERRHPRRRRRRRESDLRARRRSPRGPRDARAPVLGVEPSVPAAR